MEIIKNDFKSWKLLIDNMLETINNHLKYNPELQEGFKLFDLKEKFGGLRVTTFGEDDYIRGVVRFCETMSYSMCEKCCSTEEVETRSKNGWLKTYCKKCEDERK